MPPDRAGTGIDQHDAVGLAHRDRDQPRGRVGDDALGLCPDRHSSPRRGLRGHWRDGWLGAGQVMVGGAGATAGRGEPDGEPEHDDERAG